MYVTKRISDIRRQPELLDKSPQDGPFSGVLVIMDEEAEAEATCCFGLCRDTSIDELPIPQNKTITTRYSSGSNSKGAENVSYDYLMLIPVVDQPLSSNIYYAIHARGRHQGEAHTSSTEEDKKTCLCFKFIHDVKSKPLEPSNPLQQFQLFRHPNGCSTYYGFESKSVSPDAFPPEFLRKKGWTVYAEKPKDFTLGEAHGVDPSLRRRLPVFEFSKGEKTSARVTVGKWVVPFMFVREGGMGLKAQMKKSMYYEMSLEQRWERVFESENVGGSEMLGADVAVKPEVVLLGGREAGSGVAAEGVVWYRSGEGGEVGLSSGIAERMRWEQRRAGWDAGVGKDAVNCPEELDGGQGGGWRRFALYMLVESFHLKRMDGSVVISFEFYHIHQRRSKWE
uniref:Uncharacterized protein n=1 Tax=Kalanchoe fedtschenkoi TaxID=63787 RepID=A0A7N0VCK3_KALFE